MMAYSRRGLLKDYQVEVLQSLGMDLKFEKEDRETKSTDEWLNILEDYLIENKIENLTKNKEFMENKLGLWKF